jgi:uncharacterized protein YbbK (DUF523 family)
VSLSGRPRVGVSRCLLGDTVRYDGGHKYEASVIDTLGAEVEWVAVCPELEVGMGVPREPVHLAARDDGSGVRLLGVESRTDWTERVHHWAGPRLDALAALNIAGFVLKSRSPSCGLRDVPVDGAPAGRGLFAELLVEAMPDLPVEDEQMLRDPEVRRRFLQRVLARQQSNHV